MKAVLLFAGKNSRFFPLYTTHKSLIPMYGKPLAQYLIEDLIESGIHDFILITRDNDTETSQMIKQFTSTDLHFEIMTLAEANGIGEAVKLAAKHISEPFLYINSYHVAGKQILQSIISHYQEHPELDGLITGVREEHIENYGSLILEGKRVRGIVEKPARDKAPSFYKASIAMIFKEDFFNVLNRISPHEDSYEEAVSLYSQDHMVEMYELNAQVPSLKYAWNVFDFREKLIERHTPHISQFAQVAETAIIEPSAIIDDGAVISDHAHIRGTSYIGKNAFVGDFTLVRDSDIGQDVVVGSHEEIARSIIMKGTHVHGGGYIGDSIIDRDCRIAYGFITANRRIDRGNVITIIKEKKIDTNRTRFGVVVGNGAHVGINVATMPGVLIGPGAKVWPSSTLFKNVPEKGQHKGNY